MVVFPCVPLSFPVSCIYGRNHTNQVNKLSGGNVRKVWETRFVCRRRVLVVMSVDRGSWGEL